jgi:hypothetical protein
MPGPTHRCDQIATHVTTGEPTNIIYQQALSPLRDPAGPALR